MGQANLFGETIKVPEVMPATVWKGGKLCVSIGGHCWKPRGANYSTTQPDGSPRFRECKHCGRKEDLKLKGVKGKERWSNGQHGYSKEDWKNIQEGMK